MSSANRLPDHCILPQRPSPVNTINSQCHRPIPIRFKNSSLVFALLRMHPNMQLVTVVAPGFCTPRITMHRWLDSITTATPCGLSTSVMARATCFVRRSWTCRRRENISARRAILERPRTRPGFLSASEMTDKGHNKAEANMGDYGWEYIQYASAHHQQR